MKKKVLGLLFAGLMMTGLTACKDAEEPKYALIETVTSKEDTVCTNSAWTGIQQFATEHGEVAKVYTPESDKRKDYAKAIETAIEEGAEVVVCVGDEAEVAVYEAQMDHSRVNFILLNGTPHKRFSKKDNIAKNTISLYFDSITDSFLAGYVAVANGARDLGCMGGAKDEDALLLTSGFMQGAELAAADLGLEAGTVKLRYTFTGENKLSPAYMGKALEWYTEGCEVIFAPNEQVRQAVIQAAETAQRKVIGMGSECMEESTAMLTAAYTYYGGAVYQQLSQMKNKLFEGAQSFVCGISEDAYAVVTEGANLNEAAVAQYKVLIQKLDAQVVKVNQEAAIPTTSLVTLLPYGQEAEAVQPTDDISGTNEAGDAEAAGNTENE